MVHTVVLVSCMIIYFLIWILIGLAATVNEKLAIASSIAFAVSGSLIIADIFNGRNYKLLTLGITTLFFSLIGLGVGWLVIVGLVHPLTK